MRIRKQREQSDRAPQEKRKLPPPAYAGKKLWLLPRDLTETTLAKRWGKGGCGEIGLVRCVV